MRPRKKRPGEITSKYNTWRSAVKKRDGNRCQMPGCGKFSYYNDVHHIQRYASAVELRYLESNGITLCKKCHKKINGVEEYYAVLFTTIVHEKIKNG